MLNITEEQFASIEDLKEEKESTRKKKEPVKIDKEQKCYIKNKELLPDDAYLLRYDELISQDIKLIRHNTKVYIL